jgi:antitoxin component YwqK of YwqJK toxin-antitoxin module
MKPIINKYKNGNIRWIEYFNDNSKFHREDGPAYQSFYSNGNIKCEEWYINGKKHREDGPTIITYHENGNIEQQTYIINNVEHRTDGPAYTLFDINGNILYHIWYKNNEYHRTDGPAKIYDLFGISIEEYFINGIQLTKQEFIIHNRKRKLEIINGTENN